MSLTSDQPQVMLLGTVHSVQFIADGTAWATRQKKFKLRLEKLIQDFTIRFIGEEAAENRLSSAGCVAMDAGIPYVRLDISICAQNQIRYHPEINEPDKPNGRENPYAEAWDLVREYHMYRRFMESRGSHTPSLIICGKAHKSRLEKLLEVDFNVQVKTWDIDKTGELTDE